MPTVAYYSGDNLAQNTNSNTPPSGTYTVNGNIVLGVAATTPAASSAYAQYNGTSMLLNVPPAQGFSVTIGGSGNLLDYNVTSPNGLYVGGAGGITSANGLFTSNAAAIAIQPTGNFAVNLTSRVADGASALGVTVNNSNALTTAGAKLLSIRNNTVERLAVDLSGALLLTNNSGALPASTSAYLMWDSANNAFQLNAPASQNFNFKIGGTNKVTFASTGTGELHVDNVQGLNAANTIAFGATGAQTDLTKTGTGDLGIGPNSANSIFWLYAGSAGAARTAYAFVDLNGISSLKGLAVQGVSTVKIAAYSASTADSLVLADPNAAAGSFAATLPLANAKPGQILTVKVTAIHATRVITVIRNGTDTIEGVSAGQLTTTFGTTVNLASATFQSDGVSKWYLISSNGSVS